LLYSFENYTLDTDRRELRRESDLIAVEPQVFDILEYLSLEERASLDTAQKIAELAAAELSC
jgi:DNA-binding winged helix-turn-helix (wHTH) protein